MESGSYCRRHKREKAREKRGQVLKEIITGCAITHHSTFLGKCDPGIQTRCYQSPLPPTHLSTKETPDGYVQRTKIRGKWRVGGEKIDKSKGVFPQSQKNAQWYDRPVSASHCERSREALEKQWALSHLHVLDVWMLILVVWPPTSVWLNYRWLSLVSMVTDWKKIEIYVLWREI